jgi:hypothetical protein
MRRPTLLARALILALFLAPLAPGDAQTAEKDAAARGLDVFVHAPDSAAPRAIVPLAIEAFGFPTAASLAPLPGAIVEAAWNPEKLGPGATAAPPSVRATTDAAGRARLLIEVPDGDERALELLVGVRTGSHERTRRLSIKRGPLHAVDLHVPDTRVVPGSSVSAWVLVTRASTGEPVASAPVELALVEGGVPRHTIQLTTDGAGTAMARVPIPMTDEPSWSWTLRARSQAQDAKIAGEAALTLSPREETPATPEMRARFDEDAVLAGDRAAFTVSLRDATGRPIASHPVRYWIGPKGTAPPKDDAEWDRVAKHGKTDAEGELHGAADTPTLVVHGVGTALHLVVKAMVDGYALEQRTSVSVGVPTSTATLTPEAESLVPGVEQRLFLRVRDGHARPVAATFAIEGDGLAQNVTTDADGEAEVVWRPPVDVGALRNVGPCAGGVAAAVVVRPVGNVPALAPRTEPFSVCVRVDRDASALVTLDRPIARAGDRVHVRVIEVPRKGDKPKPASPGAYSVVLRSPNHAQAASAWIEDPERGADVEIPAGAPGAWSIAVASPSPARAAKIASGAVLVTPRVLPNIAAAIAGGRAAPGGTVDVDAELTDGKGNGVQGTVAAVLMDLRGGGSVAGLDGLDARRSLCRTFGVERARCDRFVEGDAALDPLRRGVLGPRVSPPVPPVLDPGGTARAELFKTFADVLRSLEGAVFEAAASAERLPDVRRKGARGYTWNPELMTLVTAAMDPPPLTPGGEPFALADLLALDPQVTFDNVARRVTRLKLFHLLSQVRAYRRERQLDPDEPIFKDPNALLRRLVREGRIQEEMLLDPWGGTIQFVAASGPPLPFLTVIRGFELRAPGPDGRAGTADDVRDPFERVLKSGTPYAKALGEDRLVDARLDMEVGDSTVSAWQALLEELTGTSLGGRGEGIGLGSVGTLGHGGGTGSGQGFGSGHGRLGFGVNRGVAWWSAPVRTDARGRVRFQVPLGDAETTWRVALVGVPDGIVPATTWLDVPVSLPLSARVDAGARWVEGDTVEAAITVRNRTAKPVRATLSASASGAAKLADPKDATRTIDVPAGGETVARVPVTAPAAGEAELAITVRAPDLPEDVARQRWEVLPAGEPTDLTRAQWVEKKAVLTAAIGDRALDDRDRGPLGVRLTGAPRLVLERGLERPLAAALEAMDPDRMTSREALADAIEVGVRIARWSTARSGDKAPLTARAEEIVRRARGRLAALGHNGGSSDAVIHNRVRLWVPPGPKEKDKGATCPSGSPREEGMLATLEGEPLPEGGAALACWDALVGDAVEGATASGDPVSLALVFLALAERPHRAALATTVIDRLREKVALRASGAIALPEAAAKNRASRAIVYAALLRGVRLTGPGPDPARPRPFTPASADRLAAWIGVQRDADGGYGSALATREVVRALLDAGLEEQATTRVSLTIGDEHRHVEVPPSARIEVPLPAAAISVTLETDGPGLVARLERPVVRLWSRPPEAPESPLRLDVTWPSDAQAGKKGVVAIALRNTRGKPTVVDVRIPLPPGAALAAPVNDVRQVQGALHVRRALDASGLVSQIDLPVRFTLAGKVTVPEARATLAHEEAPRAVAPARPLVIR